MQVRPTDENGDIMPVTSLDSMAVDTDAVRTVIASSLHLLAGEWWEDDDLGFYIPEWLFEGARGPDGVKMLTAYISTFISEVEGVTGVFDESDGLVGHDYTYSCRVTTDYGETDWSVENDELLVSVLAE